MTTPAAARVAAGQRDGYVAQGGVSALRAMLLDTKAATEFKEWSEQRMTRLVRDALRDLALSGPLHVGSSDVAMQYGVTSGLALALQLVTDPSLVYPELFTGVSAKPKPVPAPDYGTSISDLLDTGKGKE